MSSTFLGASYALLASICFAIGPTLNTLAGRKVSVMNVNRVRLLSALTLLIILHWLTLRIPFPFHAGLDNWMYMGLSGLLGMVIGDMLLFAAFNTLGTRLSMLVISLIPMFSSLLAWFLLDEKLALVQILGIMVIVMGIGWVLLDHNNQTVSDLHKKVNFRGFLLGFGSAFFHAAAAIAAKAGLAGDFPALSAHTIRTFVALVLILLPTLFMNQSRSTLMELRLKPEAVKFLILGAVFGPFLGMWLALLAIQNLNVGIATSITSLPPIWLIPVGRYFFKEKFGWKAVAGSMVAVFGVVLMFLA
jgi:drug/metabolite transporter (DMT)-like permease